MQDNLQNEVESTEWLPCQLHLQCSAPPIEKADTTIAKKKTSRKEHVKCIVTPYMAGMGENIKYVCGTFVALENS